jgi:hypothetical protein
MICIAITAVAFDAISSSLPIGSIAYEAEVNAKGERLIWLERWWADTLDALRGKGESYSEVILRVAAVGPKSLNDCRSAK